MNKTFLSASLAAALCGLIVSTSFAQSVSSVDLKRNDFRVIRDVPEVEIPDLVEKGPIKPAGDVMNWVAVAAVAAAVVAATSVAHHYKESWMPGGIENPVDVINPVSKGIFDVGGPQTQAGF